MKAVFLSSFYRPLLTSDYSYLFSNESFFKNLNFKDKKIKYEFPPPLILNYQSCYASEMKMDAIIKNIEFDLYKNLNTVHSTHFSNRYWKIIIGHWVSRFVKLVYFRYQILDQSFKNNCKFDFAYASNFGDYSQATNTTADLWLSSIDEEWNYNLFSKILEISFPNNCSIKHAKTKNLSFYPKIKNASNSRRDILKTKIQNFLSLFNFLGKNNSIVFKNTYLSFCNELKLSLLNLELPTFLYDLDFSPSNIDYQKRKKLNINKDECENFEKLVRNLITEALPKIVIEDYEKIVDTINNSSWPKNPKIIFTSNSYDADDFFKIWAAEKIEKNNSQYIIGQHGLFDSSEKLLKNTNDYQTCDKYLRWGKKKYDKDIEFLNFNIINKKINVKDNNILIFNRTAGHEVETYSRLDEFKIYNKCLENLLDSFARDEKKKTIVRLKKTFKRTNPKEFINLNKKFPTIKIDDGKISFYSSLKKAKLAIFLYYSTGVLQAISLDVPSVFYLPKNLVYIDPQEKIYLDLLNSCKILSYTEEELKTNVNIILNNVPKWWECDLVKKARKDFCFRYSRTESQNPILKLSKLLKSFT